MLLKDERDTSIQKTFSHHNLGNVPSTPFSTEVVLNLTNRIKSRLGEFEMDLVDKKVLILCFLQNHFFCILLASVDILRHSELSSQKSNETALSTAWDCYMDANDRWKSIEAQKRAKDDIKVWFTNWNSSQILQLRA